MYCSEFVQFGRCISLRDIRERVHCAQQCFADSRIGNVIGQSGEMTQFLSIVVARNAHTRSELLHGLLHNTDGAKCGLSWTLYTVDELLVQRCLAYTSSRAVVCLPHKRAACMAIAQR